MVTRIIDEACAGKREQDHRIRRAANKVYSGLEGAKTGAAFAEAGQFDYSKAVLRKKEKEQTAAIN